LGAWEIFKDAIFWVIDWNHSWCGDWGLAIIIVTIMFRILIYPITRKQYKSSYQMQKMQPRVAEIKEKYADDQQRQQQETMKLYQEAKFNPLAGCLPAILQMPIFIALYQVLQELQTRIGTNETVSFYGLVPDLTVSPNTVFTEQGVLAVVPYVLMLVLFAGSLLVPMLLQRSTQDRNMRIMMMIMPVVMLFFGWSVPAGVLLYWDVSSYIGVGQQYVSRFLLQRKDAQAEEEAVLVTPVKVEVDRVERKARPKKKR
jgi:YidC/Oxa1 family membrane protein insertase